MLLLNEENLFIARALQNYDIWYCLNSVLALVDEDKEDSSCLTLGSFSTSLRPKDKSSDSWMADIFPFGSLFGGLGS